MGRGSLSERSAFYTPGIFIATVAGMTKFSDIRDLIDLRRYPIDAPGQAQTGSFVSWCRDEISRHGVVILEQFTPDLALKRLREEWTPLLPDAFYTDIHHNCFLMPSDAKYPPDHPRNRTMHNNKGGIADDLIPTDALLRQIYDWPPFRRFVGAVVDEATLVPLADPLSSLNINIHRQNQIQGWHFDGAQFAITLMLQTAHTGGEFKYTGVLRDESDAEFERIGAVLDGDDTEVSTLNIQAGTLVIFRGHRSLHCVTGPKGDRPRVNAILSYASKEGVALPEHTRQLFYGRTA